MKIAWSTTKISKWKLAVATIVIGGVYFTLKPVYNRAWYRVHKATCFDNLKDIGLAMKLYARDADDSLPPVFSSSGSTGWADNLVPYLEQVENPYTGRKSGVTTFQCPFDANQAGLLTAASGFTDYWYNANVMQKTPRGVLPIRLSSLQSPAQKILAGCGASATAGRGFDATFNQCGDGTSLLSPNQTCKLANGKAAIFPGTAEHIDGLSINLLFVDGHVKNFSSPNAMLLDNGATAKSVGGSGTFALLKR